MKFALFYEIPVARPWAPDSEHLAYKNTLEQAIAGEQAGFHAFWTVEHHFLEEYSHCSNPEVLYGAIASRTSKMRLGYGVRLMPRPYNHPVRTAESVAVLDLLSDGRVDMGTGRSATRIELEGFGVDPKDTRDMWREAIEHVVGCWTNERYSFEGKYWSLPDRRVQPKPLQQPHPPIYVGAMTAGNVFRRVMTYGNGWMPWLYTPEQIRDGRAMLDKFAREFGRNPRSIVVVDAPVAAEPDVIKQYEDAGADGIVVFVTPAAEQEMLAELEQIAAKIIG
jgi:alkanesulfonate monooxygenase SsuD/methylene tetrahydromethanopterin reductase-like flavin-dependent oxidoreductase (luciferase family)